MSFVGVVDVRQHRGAKPLWHDGLFKTDVLPDPVQHPAKLCVAEGSIAAEYEIIEDGAEHLQSSAPQIPESGI
jgi:hypothetical protein